MGEITEEHGPDNSPSHSRVPETGVDGGEGDRQRREEVEVADMLQTKRNKFLPSGFVDLQRSLLHPRSVGPVCGP